MLGDKRLGRRIDNVALEQQEPVQVSPDPDRIAAAMRSDGYVVLPDLLGRSELDGLKDALAPHLAFGPRGRNPFEGVLTQRVYALLAKSPVFADLVEHPTVLRLVDEMLQPGYLISAYLAINILPGERAQPIHFDDSFAPLPRPRPSYMVSALWAVDAFTEENGSTELIPGSHLWGEEQPTPDDLQIQRVVMNPGSVLLMMGLLWHRGGANRSGAARLCVSPQYCAPWQRQQESHLLAVPPAAARDLAPRVQQLIGYDIHPPHMGLVNGMHPRRLLDPAYAPGTVNVAAEYHNRT
jgi:ectoine hydroxylase-related dioxygenase (phytanoyl-CoA dioxygenase family)